MGLQSTEGDKSPVAYARGSERGCYRTATVRESVQLERLSNE